MPNGLSSVPGYNNGTTATTFAGIFEGVPHNGPVTKTLTDVSTGYNLIGNPYSSPISISAFFAANTNTIDRTV